MRSLVMLLVGLPAAGALAAPAPKIDVCHHTGNGGSHIINVSANALQGHLGHGDHVVGPEVCDGIDNDCNGAIDDAIAPVASACGVGACAAEGSITCIDGALVDDCAPGAPSAEVCDGIDNDCDGAVDDGIAPIASACGVGACAAQGSITCIDGALVDDCMPGAPSAEDCDGIDNDCDGAVDDGVAIYPSSCGVGACAASGELLCVGGVYVDSCVAGSPADEVCGDAVDNDCNGAVDDLELCSDPVCGDGVVQHGGTVTSATFEWLATACSGGQIRFYVNGQLAHEEAVPAYCTCTPGLSTFTTTSPAILALFTGSDTVQVVSDEYLAWALVTLDAAGQVQTTVLFDANGGGSAEARNPDLCASSYEYGTSGAAAISLVLDEECDDGNLVSGDGCSASCRAEICGNGRIDAGEQCDDGNAVDGDGCGCGCIDTDSDESNCGGCGVVCGPATPYCYQGVCTDVVCHDIGYQACPTGATDFCVPPPLDPHDSEQARVACETCFGQACYLEYADCAGGGWGWRPAGSYVCGEPYWGFDDGCSGAAGRVWGICNSYTTYGLWAQ